ncbi:MAG: serine hydrolase domain-containing protein [Chloroflexota bacterium]|nr:serine hydrolase domain-containing protein [Chloroflexota bacterium]
MQPKAIVTLTIFLALVFLSACGSQPTAIPTPTEAPPAPTSTPAPTNTPASPESQDMDPAALAELVEIVSGYVENEKVVGAELAVIKNRQVVLHEAFGWKDKDDGLTLETNSLYNIRSMTKPITGMAIQMLVDEGKLALADRVADYLPSFDNEQSGEITVDQLLSHRGGLPLSIVMTGLGEIDSLRALADDAGEKGPESEPGSGFHYSDTGSDVLGALVEEISGMTLGEFWQERIFDPLAMADTISIIEEGDPRVSRIVSGYYGSTGDWSRYWGQEDELIYPFTMGSQSVYSTILDYARFLALWMDGGQLNDQRLLSPEAVERALTPVVESNLPGGFPGLRLDYGQKWIVYVPEDAPEGGGEMMLFGHSGSDGTWAWAWPEQDLMVFYFTQSRGQGSGIGLEAELDRLLIHPDQEVVAIPEELKPYLGVYTTLLSGPLMNKEFEVLVQNGKLAVNLPEQIVVALQEPDDEGFWRLTIDPSIAVSFVQNEVGEVVALNWHQAGQVFEIPRGEVPDEEPLDEASVQKYLGSYTRPEEEGSDPVEVLIHNDHLGLKMPEVAVVLELFPPDEDGRWAIRLNPAVSISFQEDEDGVVVSFTSHSPEGDFVRPRVDSNSIVIPSGTPPTIDGTLSPGEWDKALVETFSDGSELLLMYADDYLYLGVRSNTPEMIGANVYIEDNGQIMILHTSAALGTAIYQQGADSWQQTQDFDWQCRNTGNGAVAQAGHSAYLQENHWLAANSRVGAPNELEYQIEVTDESPRIAVSVFRSSTPNERAFWPSALDDDTIQPYPGGLPTELHFSPDQWGMLDLKNP